MSDQMTQQTTEPTEPTSTPTQEPSPAATDPAPATHAEAPPTEPEPQQTTEPQSTTAQEPPPAEPTEPGPQPGERVVPKPSEYELPEGTPDDLRIFAHEQGFTQDQLNAALTRFGSYMHGMRQAEQQALRQAGETHLKNWGPDAKNKLALAKAALRQNDPEGKLLEALNTSGYGNHPDVLNFLYNIGKSMQEGGFIKSTIPKKKGEKTLASAMFGANHPTEG